jgi:hypothetical protein
LVFRPAGQVGRCGVGPAALTHVHLFSGCCPLARGAPPGRVLGAVVVPQTERGPVRYLPSAQCPSSILLPGLGSAVCLLPRIPVGTRYPALARFGLSCWLCGDGSAVVRIIHWHTIISRTNDTIFTLSLAVVPPVDDRPRTKRPNRPCPGHDSRTAHTVVHTNYFRALHSGTRRDKRTIGPPPQP